MKNFPLLGALLLLAACTSPQQPVTENPLAAAPELDPVAVTQTQASAIATRYFRSRPDSAVYLLSTLRVLEAGPHWQVLVKRADRAGRMSDNSAIEVDKQTGAVSTVLVK